MSELKKHTLLIVDDNQELIEGLYDFFFDRFNILTAASPLEAEKILEKKYSEISILISDQKMGGDVYGLDFLKNCEKKYPNIIKILMTAYSNHNLAIDAVNSGVLYQYVTKPLDMEIFSQTVLRAADLFTLKKERNFLAQEKMLVLQQMIFTDRLRNLATLAAGFSGHVQNSIPALKKFLSLSPEDAFSEDITNINSLKNIISKAKEKNSNFITLVENIRKAVVKENHNYQACSLNKIIEAKTSQAKDKYGVSITSEFNNIFSDIKADSKILENIFESIIEYLVNMNIKAVLIKFEESSVNETKGIKISFISNPTQSGKNIWKLLPIFFGVFHHFGDVEITDNSNIFISLPIDPNKASIKNAGNYLLDDFFEHFEAIKYYETWLSVI